MVLLEGRIPIKNKWVYWIKRKANGEIDKYHARLVTRRFLQTKGINFHETFAPIANFPSITTMLALIVAFNFKIHQMDVKSTILNKRTKGRS
jgi:hypothetical protein